MLLRINDYIPVRIQASLRTVWNYSRRGVFSDDAGYPQSIARIEFFTSINHRPHLLSFKIAVGKIVGFCECFRLRNFPSLTSKFLNQPNRPQARADNLDDVILLRITITSAVRPMKGRRKGPAGLLDLQFERLTFITCGQ